MSDWKKYLDQEYGKAIHTSKFDPDENLLEKGTLRPGASTLILNNMRAAHEFLMLMRNGQVDIARQQRAVRLLHDINGLIHARNHGWHELQPEFFSTLCMLRESIGPYMEAHGADLTLSEEDLSYTYGFGEGVGSITYGLPIARNVALKAFIEAFCAKFIDNPTASDLCGDWRLVITEPKVPKFSRKFSGIYGGASHAKIQKIPHMRVWHLNFLDFPPIKSWYSLERAAYEAAAPLVEQTLAASAHASGNLWD